MQTLTILTNRMSYGGLFATPAFSLTRNADLGEKLFNAFSPFGIDLASLREEGSMQIPASVVINILLGALGIYKLRLTGVEWSVPDYQDEAIPKFPEILQSGADMLKSLSPDLTYQSHLFLYNCHAKLSEGTGKEVISQLACASPVSLGEELGNGIIHNWMSPEIGARVSFMLDLSQFVPDGRGVFAQLALNIGADLVNYTQIQQVGTQIFDAELEGCGLRVEREIQIG
jgi:hypothetical protein